MLCTRSLWEDCAEVVAEQGLIRDFPLFYHVDWLSTGDISAFNKCMHIFYSYITFRIHTDMRICKVVNTLVSLFCVFCSDCFCRRPDESTYFIPMLVLHSESFWVATRKAAQNWETKFHTLIFISSILCIRTSLKMRCFVWFSVLNDQNKKWITGKQLGFWFSRFKMKIHRPSSILTASAAHVSLKLFRPLANYSN